MKKALVAMSGGVDSAVAALLLKGDGYDLTGITMRLWDASARVPDEKLCAPDENATEAKKIADELTISQVFPIRGGNISGLHKIIFLGDGEEIEITHRAYEKSVFAKGALYCANKLLQKEKGLYTIEQLINE